MSKEPLKVLIVGDEADLSDIAAKLLTEGYNYAINIANSFEKALEEVSQADPSFDVAVIDNLLRPHRGESFQPSGIELMNRIKDYSPETVFIILSHLDAQAAFNAMQAGAFRCLFKPVNLDELAVLVRHAIECERLRRPAPAGQLYKLLLEISDALHNAQSQQEVFDKTLLGIGSIGFDRARIFSLSEDQQSLIGRAETGVGGNFIDVSGPVFNDILVNSKIARPQVLNSSSARPSFEALRFEDSADEWVEMPLVMGANALGWLLADNSITGRAITDEQLDLLALIAFPVTAALESQRKARNLNAVLNLSTSVNSTLDLGVILSSTCRLLVSLIGAQHSGLVLYNPELESGEVVAEYPEIGTCGAIIPMPDVPAARRLYETREPIIIDDVESEPLLGLARNKLVGWNIRSMLIIPIVGKQGLLGSFGLDAISYKRQFTLEEIQLCKLIAAQVAVAIENVRLFEQTMQRAEQLDALRRTTLAVTSTREHSDLLTLIVNQAVILLKAKSGGIYKYYPQLEQLTVIIDSSRPHHVGQSVDVGEGVAGWLVLSQEEYKIVDDYNQWPNKARFYDYQDPLPAVLEVPLKWQGETIGVLYIEDELRRKFTAEDARLLSMFADQAAIALVNAELIEKDREKLEKLERLSIATKEIMGNLSARNIDDRLTLIVKHAAEILNAEICVILLVKREGFLSLEASYGHLEGRFEKGREFAIRSGLGTGLTGHIAYKGELFNRYGEELTRHPAVAGEKPAHLPSKTCYSLLAIPLKKKGTTGGELIGLLRVENKKGPNGHALSTLGFNLIDEQVLHIFAETVEAAIESAELVKELSERKDYLARLIASSPNGIIEIDVHGNLTGLNEKAQRVLECSREQVMTKSVANLYYDPEEPRKIGKLLNSSDANILVNHETYIKNRKGQAIPISLSATWLYDAESNRIGSVGYFEDLRPKRQQHQKLELLLKASNIIAEASSIKDGLGRLAEMMVSLITSSFCRILLIDETEQYLIPKATFPILRPASGEALDWEPGLEQPFAITEHLGLGERLHKGEPYVLCVDDSTHRQDLVKLSGRLKLRKCVQSLLVIPLKVGVKVVGLIEVGELRATTRASFDKGKIGLSAGIAAQTAALIDRHRLSEFTDRHMQLLKALVQVSQKIRAVRHISKLMKEIVRLAAGLVDCEAGALYINHSHINKLELIEVHGLRDESIRSELMGTRLSHGEGVAGLVAQTRDPMIVHDYSDWPDHEAVLEALKVKTVIAVPLKGKESVKVDAVLVVADEKREKAFTINDRKVLEDFAAQAAIALQTSRLITRKQRMSSQLSILLTISNYIQTAGELDKILHVVLTGITADYGLRFNRAVLLLIDDARENLVGRKGIGQFDKTAAREAWTYNTENGLDDFAHYLELLGKKQIGPTPVEKWTEGLRLPVNSKPTDAFSRAVLERRPIQIEPGQADQLPGEFINKFAPTTPLIIAPLTALDEVIGLLVVDNKFTQSSIKEEDVDSLMMFANNAAIAIYNNRMLEQTRSGREKLLKFYKGSSNLMEIQDPDSLLRTIVEQTLDAADATWVSLLLIDELGRAHNPITVGRQTHFGDEYLVRPNGNSMAVMKTGRVFTISDIKKEPDRVNPVMLKGDTRAAVCLPLSLVNERIGVMWIHYEEPRSFSNFDIGALQLYVNQTATAYDSVRRMKKLNDMREAADALARTSDSMEVLEQIIQSSLQVMKADAAVLWFYDDQKDSFISDLSKAAGVEPDLWKDYQTVGPESRRFARKVLKEGLQVIHDINDPRNSKLLGAATRKILKQMGGCCLLGILLKVGKESLGVLYLIYKSKYFFGQEEGTTALMFANHAALALKKARLLDHVRSTKEAFESVARVTVLGDREGTLRSITRETKKAVKSDEVVLFEYNNMTGRIMHPPTIESSIGCYNDSFLEEGMDDALVYKMLERTVLYSVDDVYADPVFCCDQFPEEIKSSVAAPLRMGERKLGVMFVNYCNSQHFTADEESIIQLFANQAAVAIHNSQLFEERSKQLREQGALVDLSQKLLGTFPLESKMNSAVEVAAQVLGTEYCNIVIPDKDSRLTLAATYGLEKELIGNLPLESGNGSQTGYTMMKEKPIRIEDYNDPRHFNVPSIVFEREIKAGISVPFSDGSVKGVMLAHTKQRRRFSDEEENLLMLIANATAMAMKSANQYDAIERQSRFLNALYDAAKAINDSFGPNRKQVLDQIVQQAVDCLSVVNGPKAILGTIELYNKETDILAVESVYPFEKYSGLIEEIGKERSVDRKKVVDGKVGISGRALLTRRSQLVFDVKLDPDYLVFNESTLAELSVPLIDGDEVLGVLNIESDQIGGFDEEDMEGLEALSHLAVTVIKNASRYEEISQIKGLVGARTALAWMGMASSAWRHVTQQHAININLGLDLMKRDISRCSLTQEQQQQLFKRFHIIKNEVAGILEEKITPPLSSTEEVEVILLNELIVERLTQLRGKNEYSDVVFEYEGAQANLGVRVSSEWLRRALDILIDNAVEAMSDSPVKRLTVSTRQVKDRAEIQISDTGRGIEPGVREKILKQPIYKPGDTKGFGIGLLIVQAIVETYKGEIRLDPPMPSGASFTIYFPLV
jgi:PAS domain S-box-containing protein